MDLIGTVVGTAVWLGTSYVAIRLFRSRVVSRVVGAVTCGCALSLGTLIAAWAAAAGGPLLFAFLLVTQSLVGIAMAYLILPSFLTA